MNEERRNITFNVANTNSTSKYFSETSTNIKDAYYQLPNYQRNNPSLRESKHPNDQLHPQEEELGLYLADIFSHLNINEQEESIQQTTTQASHQKNKDKKSRTQRKRAQIRRKMTNEQQRKKMTTCQNQTQEISRSLKESGSQTQRPLQVMAKIEVPKESTLGSIEFKIRLK
jgi:hypothetical protein